MCNIRYLYIDLVFLCGLWFILLQLQRPQHSQYITNLVKINLKIYNRHIVCFIDFSMVERSKHLNIFEVFRSLAYFIVYLHKQNLFLYFIIFHSYFFHSLCLELFIYYLYRHFPLFLRYLTEAVKSKWNKSLEAMIFPSSRKLFRRRARASVYPMNLMIYSHIYH